MKSLWIIPGIILIVVGWLDLFLSALNYNQSGFVTLRLQEVQWRVLRAIFRGLPASWLGFARAQVIGLQFVLNLVVWVGLEIVGFGLLYYGLMTGHDFMFSGSHTGPSLDYAVYFSLSQLSTVGSSSVTPNTTLLRMLSVVETLIGLAFITLAISFLISIFQTITSLRALAGELYLSSPATNDPTDILALYFHEGAPLGLNGFLDRLYRNLTSYYSGLELHHTAYYYQSRQFQMSLPYAFQALGGIIGALRWGLPAGNPVSCAPTVTLLLRQFTSLLDYLVSQRQWQAGGPAAVQPYGTFAPAFEGRQPADDPWLGRFLAMERGMRRLARSDARPDVAEAYARYAAWTPFASHVQTVVDRTARHLGYDLPEAA